MKWLPAAVILSLFAAGHAHADWDPEAEARYQAERDAARREEEARQREADKIKAAAEAKMNAGIMAEKRKYVGAAANGKSDAEVNRLYDAKVAKTTQDAYAGAAEAKRRANTTEGRGATKEVTGHTMEEIQNMSDAELEALSQEMEKKYGN